MSEYPVDYALVCRHGCRRIVSERPCGPTMGSCCDAMLASGERCLGLFFYATAAELEGHQQFSSEQHPSTTTKGKS